MSLDHVPRYDGQNGGQSGQWNPVRERRGEDHERQQKSCVQDASDRPVRVGANVGRRARNRAGDAEAAKQCAGDIGPALRHQFAIGAMTPACHAVGHNGRKQGFHAAQKRQRDGDGDQIEQRRKVDVGQARNWQTAGDAAEFGADGFNRQVKPPRQRRAQRHCRKQARKARREAAQDQDRRQTECAYACGGPVDRPGHVPQGDDFWDQRTGLGGQRQAEEVPDLGCEDDDPDARRKANGDGVGNVFDINPELQIADQQQQQPGHDRGGQKPLIAIGCDDAGHQHDEGARRSADLKTAAAQS